MDSAKPLNEIFLSASIPLPERNPVFFESADIIAIRDAVRALATVVVPKAKLIWGGHPSITPLIKLIIEKMGGDEKDHVLLYQSEYFREIFPEDNQAFENIKFTQKLQEQTESLLFMRKEMISKHHYKAGIFIGGMEGILDEHTLFKEYHPEALVLPVATTGAAAKILYDEYYQNMDARLRTDYAYMALFRDLLSEFINE